MDNKNDIKFETIMVTPQMARAWLDNKGDNRRISGKKVTEYTNQIKSGQWRYTHQGIAFDEKGQLLDGQHRLTAVVEAGIAVKMVKASNVYRGEFTIIDRGYPRDMETITGIPKYFNEVYIFMVTLFNGNGSRANPDDVNMLHATLKDASQSLQSACNNHAKFLTTVPIRTAGIVAIESGEDKDYVLSTYKLFATRDQSMPAIAWKLLNQYIDEENKKRYSLAGWNTRRDLYLKARYMFSKEKQKSGQVSISNDMADKYILDVKNIINKALIGSFDSGKNELLKIINQKDKELKENRRKYIKALAMNKDAENSQLSMEAVN